MPEKTRDPASTRDVFGLLAQGKRIPAELAEEIECMVGFRNIAVHDYQALLLPIPVRIIKEHPYGLLDCGPTLLRGDAVTGP